MIRVYSNNGCSASKLIFNDETTTTTKTNKKPLQEANVCSSCISFSLSQLSTERHKQTQPTNRKARLEHAIRDAQNLAQNVFPPIRPTLTSRSLQSIARPFQKRFRKVFGNARILIFNLSMKAWEQKYLPKSRLGWFFLMFSESKATKENI